MQRDDFDRKRLKALTDKKSRLIIERDVLQDKYKK